jgi:hypothetical protein
MKPYVIKELASYFDKELQKRIPLTILPTGGLVYQNYLVKRLENDNWGVFNIHNKDMKNQYYTRSCALMAAKFYSHRAFTKSDEVKDLDDNYWSNYSDSLIFKHNLSSAPSTTYPIILTRLEESQHLSSFYRAKIFIMFRHTFG